MNPPQDRGLAGEQLALAHLQAQGLRPVARNVRCRGGELDLVMLDGSSLVFIEVRSRHAKSLVSPFESITLSKQRRLWRCAQNFLLQHPEHALRPCRFDVVGITYADGRCTLEWIPHAFERPL